MDRRITGEMNYLASKGHHVVFLSPKVDLNGAGVSPQVRCLVPPQEAAPSRVTGITRNRRLRERILSLPAFLARPLCALAIWVLDRIMYRELEAKLKREMPGWVPDYIHIHDLRLADFAVHLKKSFFPNVKLIYDSHELTPFQTLIQKLTPYFLRREKRAVRKMDAVITVNPSIAERMSELYGIPKPKVLYNSQESFESTGSDPVPLETVFGIPKLPESAVKVLFQGSLTPDRNIESLLKAFQLLPDDFHLFVLGNGPDEHLVREITSPQIHFHNAVEQIGLQDITNQATFGIIPYLATNCENNLLCTPNKLFEFINAKLPICSAELREVHKILSECGNGRCYPMETPEKIAAAIKDFSDRLKNGQITKDNLEFAAETYSYKKRITVLDEIYI